MPEGTHMNNHHERTTKYHTGSNYEINTFQINTKCIYYWIILLVLVLQFKVNLSLV